MGFMKLFFGSSRSKNSTPESFTQPDSPEKSERIKDWLKCWRQDLPAAFFVSLIALIFGLMFAKASGFPPVAGLITSIIAGLLMPLPWFRGSHATITGPAAGLAPTLMMGCMLLGGSPKMQISIMLAGVFMLLFVKLKLTQLLQHIPHAVVDGMLAGIGVIIVVQQIPNFMGVKFDHNKIKGIWQEYFSGVHATDTRVLLLAIISFFLLVALIGLRKTRLGQRWWLKKLPPQFLIVLGGIFVAWYLEFDARLCISVPDQIKDAIAFPDFSILANPKMFAIAAGIGLLLASVDTTEAGLSVKAIDGIDKSKRTSNVNRTVRSMAWLNFLGTLIGSTSFLPGGFKSTLFNKLGGKTLMGGVYVSLFLLSFLLLGRGLINTIPMAVLGAIMACTGLGMIIPKCWELLEARKIEDLTIFTVTMMVTGIQTDLLEGVGAGLGLKLLIYVCGSVVSFSRKFSSELSDPIPEPQLERESS